MIFTAEISLQSRGDTDIIDITAKAAQQVAESNISRGTVNLFVAGSTAGITTIEFEPGLVADIRNMWARLIPQNVSYDHDRRWGDGNGYSHVRAALLGASLAVPFHNGQMLLGTWQQIVVIDFDARPRLRKIIVQVTGE
ncbi:MAG: secondary thiamine-phosphate synthase enzyme YjbQ [Dehalococcoidales bacterium]